MVLKFSVQNIPDKPQGGCGLVWHCSSTLYLDKPRAVVGVDGDFVGVVILLKDFEEDGKVVFGAEGINVLGYVVTNNIEAKDR